MNSTLILEKNNRDKISKILSEFLANTYILYVKTQSFHWNVEDPRFFFLHQFFETQYEDLVTAIDEIAERMRMLKAKAPGSLKEFIEISSLDESEGNLTANQMIEVLHHDNEKMVKILRLRIEEIQKLGDEGSLDLMIQRLRVHEKAAWMLRSHLHKEILA